ncbi:MAG: UDP-glucose 4-epimerase GalE [Firmicutes bacterium HGW-Firmicutes-1]|jgi:UDP-glucose 4-epimerase|nr:MAG: UDP-glucose 4-epimerase GalE [Firmicutes bacterium HGW-Firmicutes-1]
MAILITGGTGFIGSHTVVELLGEGYEVVIVDNFSNSNPEVINRIEEISGKKIRFYEVDLLNYEKLDKVFCENDISAVIHFAGLKSVGESVAIPLRYYHNNITGTLVLCELMSKHNVKKMVFSSSATVYGMNNVSPLTEDLLLSTTNPYGSTKLMIESILSDLVVSDPEWRVVLLRYFNPIGAHESGRIGEDPNGIPNNLMPFITQVVIGKRESLNVFGSDYQTPDGTGVRDYIHVVDLAKGHLKALEKINDEKGVLVYNLGTGIGYSVLDVVRAFEKVTNMQVSYNLVDRRPGDVDICYANASKALNELGWKTEKNLEDMCRDSWNWQMKNPNGYDKR